jgi:flagellar hook-basal body complex protein FliE
MDAIGAIRTAIPDIPQAGNPPRSVGEGSFTDTLAGAMQQVDALRNDAQQQISSVLTANGGELHSATIAVEKADVAFQLMMQMRNKIVAAYQEVAHLQF